MPQTHSRRSSLIGAVSAAVAGLLAGCTSVDDDRVPGPAVTVGSPVPGVDPVPDTVTDPTPSAGGDAGAGAIDDPLPALVPEDFRVPAPQAGTLEVVSYTSRHDPQGAATTDKQALVYLPPGYDEDDATTKYDVFYLMHGGGGSEYSWMGTPESPTTLPTIFDHMIAEGLVRPLIVVAPTYDTGYRGGGGTYADNVEAFTGEVVDDLIPAVESRYRTHAESVDTAGLEASRSHRAFGGFSMGGVTTWHMLEHATDYFEYYLPMSGDSWNREMMGGLTQTEATVRQLEDAVRESGRGSRDVWVFSATGTGDMALANMDAMAAEVRGGSDVFEYTDVGFSEGNFMYWVVDGHLHDYPWGYDYVYSGLRMFFPER